MPKKTQEKDSRPRFGFCYGLDFEPQTIFEKTQPGDSRYGRNKRQCVAVVPLPFMSSKQKAKVRAFAKTLFPAE